MRITKLHTICMMTLSAILFVGLEASAQNSEMEAGVGCIEESCMFGGQTVAQNSGVAQLHKINIFSADGTDPRQSYDRGDEVAKAFAPIGMIETNSQITVTDKKTQETKTGYGKGTGFLIAPCYAMTNYHVVFGDNQTPDPKMDHSITFKVGAAANGGFQHSVKAKPVRWDKESATKKSDWVIVKLDDCVGEQIGWLELDETQDPNSLVGTKFVQAGYPKDRSNDKISIQTNCEIKDFNGLEEVYLHNCAARRQASGSPMIALINGQLKVVGISTAEMNEQPGILKAYDAKYATLGTPMLMTVRDNQVMAVIKANIGNKVNPAQPTSTKSKQLLPKAV